MYLLLIDLLGVKARWAQGAAAATEALDAFDRFVAEGLVASHATPAAGGIDSDATALVFEHLEDAVRAARAIYLSCFLDGDPQGPNRYWMRGVLVPTDTLDTRTAVPLAPPLGNLTRSVYSEALMSAVCIEASGKLKGMRLLVATDAVTKELRDAFAIKTNHGYIVPFRHLNMTQYPEGEWEDFLWMVPDNPDEWPDIEARARDRMRHAGRELAELDHAAHTRVVFDQVSALLVMQHFR